mmetsp:Transcript_14030/g.49403  ORF Transcript_14030/g.49403 Transcript_14030/m.49403 type:complete len:275 (+) Transcript_14030:1370-2194(+)
MIPEHAKRERLELRELVGPLLVGHAPEAGAGGLRLVEAGVAALERELKALLLAEDEVLELGVHVLDERGDGRADACELLPSVLHDDIELVGGLDHFGRGHRPSLAGQRLRLGLDLADALEAGLHLLGGRIDFFLELLLHDRQLLLPCDALLLALDVQCPLPLDAHGDPELLQVALFHALRFLLDENPDDGVGRIVGKLEFELAQRVLQDLLLVQEAVLVVVVLHEHLLHRCDLVLGLHLLLGLLGGDPAGDEGQVVALGALGDPRHHLLHRKLI